MLLKILIVGALAIGVMGAIRDGRILRDAGLLSHCNAVTVSGRSEQNVIACSKGRLDGFPDMTNKACTLFSARREREYWRCEAPVVSSQSPTG